MNQQREVEHVFEFNRNHSRFVYLGLFFWIAAATVAFSAYQYGVERGREQALSELERLEAQASAERSPDQKKAPIRR